MSATSRPPLAPRTIRCPACAGPSLYSADNHFRPFCSARCKGVDLGAWASESYRVEAAPDPLDLDVDDPADPNA